MKLAFVLDGKEHVLVDIRHFSSDLNLSNDLYIGGLEPDMYRTLPNLVSSRKGYSGCLATMVVKGGLVDLFNDARFKSELITQGCTGEFDLCT